MSKRTKFQDRWLHSKDGNNHTIQQWASKMKNEEYSCFCDICNTIVSSAKGLQSLIQHSNSIKHKANTSKLQHNQLLIAPVNKQSEIQKHTMLLFNPRDAASKAELLYVIKSIISDASVNSCNGVKELFLAMFPGAVPESFSLSPSKVRYLITEALGPYFKQLMVRDLQNSSCFTLQYDETSNVASKKELQVNVIYWSDSEKCIVNKHLVTYFIGKADGDTLFGFLLKALDSHSLLLKHVVMLASDGPNVNKKVLRLFKEKNKEQHNKPMIDIGSCPLHTVHNAFLKGLECLELDVSDFIVKIYYYFHKRDLRVENFEKIQRKLNLPEHKFIKHISTRWLTIGLAAARIIEQFPAIQEYFLQYVPKKEAVTISKQTYKDIVSYLKSSSLKASLTFVVYSANIFTSEFTLVMQKQEPLIHILYKQLQKIVDILLSNMLIPTNLTPNMDYCAIEELLNKPTNFLPLTDIYSGEKTKDEIEKLTERDKIYFMNNIKKNYICAIKHICNKTMNSKNLKYFECISPNIIKKSHSLRYLMKVVKILPIEVDQDKLSTEWKLLQLDEDIIFEDNNERIDYFWNNIFELKSLIPGEVPRYPVIKQVIKTILCISHGSADVERGFSRSGRLMTEDKSQMSEKMLNCKLAVVGALKQYDNKVHMVPITKELLKLANNAHNSYNVYLQEVKRTEQQRLEDEAEKDKLKAEKKILLEDIEKDKETISNLENTLKECVSSYEGAAETAHIMQGEVNKLLKDAADKKDVNKTTIANEMFGGLKRLRANEKTKKNEVEQLRKKIEKRKNEIIDKLSKKQKINN